MSLLLFGDLTQFEALCAAVQDDRPHPQQNQLEQLGAAVMSETLDVMADTALEDYVGPIAEGLIGAFHSIILRLQRDWDRAADDVKRLTRDFDGSEIADVELQEATRKAHAAEAAIRAVEMIRDQANETYTAQTGEVWTPWRGSTRRTASTAAQIDAREALRAKRARTHAAVDPGAQVVAFRGSPFANTQVDAGRIYDALNWARSQWPDMKLATTGCAGAEKLAISWARDHHVDHIGARFDKAAHGKAAPFRANDELLALEPVIVLTLAGSLHEGRAAASHPFGPALNVGQKAEEQGIRHLPVRLRA
ncbi:DUF2493 domain-containing protein (plasmid) [Brevundimonas staleyi]|uniref:DUF2493 domain-containing protein n=1 Tax=Brevundimonas staleyi TaxID=74326 RepID=A0ABW0FNE6_9CAUL